MQAPEFVQNVTATIIAGLGDQLPVSKMPMDGTFPTGTAQWEKRNISLEIPVWDENVCIQCGKCVLVCPHAVIRAKVYDEKYLADAPETFKSTPARWKEFKELKYTLQVAPEDCTGCTLCVEVCPAKNKSETRLKAINMADQLPLRESEAKNWEFFLNLPEVDPTTLNLTTVKDTQLLQPLFEFSGACSGCGETPYLKLVSQLFGDRSVIANATGCSSIYGGNLPTTPWAQNKQGRGPAWSNSLFEDNAEFGLGMRLTIDKQTEFARELVNKLRSTIGEALADELLKADQSTEPGIRAQRDRVATLKARLANATSLGRQEPAGRGRYARQEGRVDYRRRRLGLRHRLRRSRSRHRLGPQHQHPRARYRSLLEHRRAGVEGHAARGRGEVRRRRQAAAQERPRSVGDDVRQRVRGADRDGRERRPDDQGHRRSRSVRRPVVDHRVLALHQPRHQHGEGHGAAEAGRAVGVLAAVPLRSAPRGEGRESAGDRLAKRRRCRWKNTSTTRRATRC